MTVEIIKRLAMLDGEAQKGIRESELLMVNRQRNTLYLLLYGIDCSAATNSSNAGISGYK